MNQRIYFDNNATTRCLPEVFEAMREVACNVYANPSAVHDDGVAARYHVEKSRVSVAECLGCAPSEIVFTSGGTESNNLAIKGVLAYLPKSRRHIITTSIEHPAVLRTVQALEGCHHTIADPHADGRMRLEAFEAARTQETGLVTLMLANNETGVIQPVAEVGDWAKHHDIRYHCDVVQGVGKLPVKLYDIGCDTASISAHKFYGPNGVGALFIRDGVKLAPTVHGGSQENGIRSGTINVMGIVGMAAALKLATDHLQQEMKRLAELKQRLLAGLTSAIRDMQLNGDQEHCLCNTVNISIPGWDGNELVRQLSDRGISISAGSACSAGKGVTMSPVILAMGGGLSRAQSAIRLSMGHDTTAECVDTVVSALSGIVQGKLAAATS